MTRVLIDPAVAHRFPGLSVAWVVLEGLAVAGPGDAAAAAVQRAAEADARATRTAEGLKTDLVFRAYRDFYWALGIDPTKTRPSGEALNRRVLNGGALPSINSFVDAYNAASLETGVSIGAYDAERLEGNLVLRFARAGEGFRGIGEAEPRVLSGGEVMLADAAKLVNYYPYRDADATKVTTATTRALVVACGVPGVEPDLLRAATRRASANVRSACGGRDVTGGLEAAPA